MLNFVQFREELLTYFHQNWDSSLINGLPDSDPVLEPITFPLGDGVYVPKAYYNFVEDLTKLPNDRHFCRFSFQNIKTKQRSLRGPYGKKFTTPGVGVVQLFFSKSNFSSEQQDYLTLISQEMFLGKSTSSIWFRNATVRELPEEEKFFRTNVSFDYQYDTVVNYPS